jgi:hypothetical protein
MSYAVCRVQKIKGASAVAGLEIHNERERDKSHSNPDIDRSRSAENYSLIGERGKSYNVLADERIAQGYTGKKAIRKDAVRVCEALFTSDTAFFEGKSPLEQRQYFQDCHKWACERFGAENIIASTVHMDETTPHLHIDFVPLTADGRLSAKSVLGGRVDLQLMQDDFYEKVGKPWDLKRGERADLDDPNAPRPRKHQETADFKRSKAHELNLHIEALKVEQEAIQNELDVFRSKSAEIKTSKDIMLDEWGNIEELSANLNEMLKNPVTMAFMRDNIKEKVKEIKKIVKKAHSHQEKAESLAFQALESRDEVLVHNKKFSADNKELRQRVPNLEKQVKKLTQELATYKDFHKRACDFLETKGLKDECNTFVQHSREQERLALELEKELQRQAAEHFNNQNRGMSR